MDGETLDLEFTPDEKAELQRATKIKEFLQSEYLAFEVEGKLIFIPVHNIRSIMFDPTPEKGLPNIVLKNLKFLREE
jgi:hypothetical protein